jgi:hypothetical protein
MGGQLNDALASAQAARAAADAFVECLGSEHTIPSYYVLARDSTGRVQTLVVQPFLARARPLAELDYSALSTSERARIAAQLRDIIRRSLIFYRATGAMPDLYGRASASAAERAQSNTPRMLPRRIWSFLVQRNLLRSNNLMIAASPDHRIVLVDYDIVRRSRLYRMIYFGVRWMLFWRDHALILLMRRGGPVPRR